MSDELENRTFLNGRHRNKTYQHVMETDKQFCEIVLRGEKSKFIPEDFRKYLLAKTRRITLSNHLPATVSERNSVHFFKMLTPPMREELSEILNNSHTQVRRVHEPFNITSNGFLGVYVHFCVQKHVFNITNADGYCKYLENQASIFPFVVSDELKDVEQCDAKIIEFIDGDLMVQTQKFLNRHFDQVNATSVVRSFFANILNFRKKKFAEDALSKALCGIDLVGLSLNRDSGDVSCTSCLEYVTCDYFKDYPRLNKHGVKRYQQMFDMTKKVTELYNEPLAVSASKYEPQYLVKLPEINFYELFSLLNGEFFKNHRFEYTQRFEKFLFFFVHAIRSSTKPVFMIDDCLFECLKHYNVYKKSRKDIEEMLFELSMLTLVYRRKQAFESFSTTYSLDLKIIRNIKKYFDEFPGIENALVKIELASDVVETGAFVSTTNAIMDVCFRSNVQNKQNFLELLCHGVFSPNSNAFEKLFVYNGLLGIETSMDMPSQIVRNKIVEFVKKYNRYDFAQQMPPEKFLTWGHEKFYEDGVEKWNSRAFFQ